MLRDSFLATADGKTERLQLLLTVSNCHQCIARTYLIQQSLTLTDFAQMEIYATFE